MSIHLRYLIHILLVWVAVPVVVIFEMFVVSVYIHDHVAFGVVHSSSQENHDFYFQVAVWLIGLVIATFSYRKGIFIYPYSEKYIGQIDDHVSTRKKVLTAIPIAILVISVLTVVVFGAREVSDLLLPFVITLAIYSAVYAYMWKNWSDLFRVK